MSAARPDLAWADTNLFVALFADDSHPLHGGALDLFRRVADGSLRLIVTPVVIAELVYVVEAVFRWRRSTVSHRLGELVTAEGLEIREGAVVSRALELYGVTRGLDFADAYLAGLALIGEPRNVASLDRDFDRIPGIRRMSS